MDQEIVIAKVIDRILTNQELMGEMIDQISDLLKTYNGRLSMLEAEVRGEEPKEWADA